MQTTHTALYNRQDNSNLTTVFSGNFLTFEGIDGAGKTTQLELLAKSLTEKGYPICVTRQPGGTALGTQLRTLLLSESYTPTGLTELFLFAADRSQHLAEVIEPALNRGEIVLCDRYIDSTIAFQGYGRQGDIPQIRQILEIATAGLRPAATILFDLDPQLSLFRRNQRRLTQTLDRIDQESIDFHTRVRQGYLSLAAMEPDRFIVIDASQDIHQVEQATLSAVLNHISKLNILGSKNKQSTDSTLEG